MTKFLFYIYRRRKSADLVVEGLMLVTLFRWDHPSLRLGRCFIESKILALVLKRISIRNKDSEFLKEAAQSQRHLKRNKQLIYHVKKLIESLSSFDKRIIKNC